MRILNGHITGFGTLPEQDIPQLAPGLSLFIGGNEAGKSTCLDFFRTILTGYPSRRGKKTERDYTPLHGGTGGGSLFVETQAAGQLHITRRAGSGNGTLTLTDAQGNTLNPTVLESLFGGVTRELYHSVYGFGLGELQTFASLSSDGVRNALYAASFGIGIRPPSEVLKRLDTLRNDLYLPRGQKPAINKLLAEIKLLRETMRSKTSDTAAYETYAAQVAQYEENLAAIRSSKQECNEKLHRARRYQQAWQHWNEYAQIEAHIERLQPLLTSFPENGITRLEHYLERLQEYRIARNEQRTAWNRRQQEAESLVYNKKLVDLLPQLMTLAESKGIYRAATEALPRLATDLEHAQHALTQSLATLGAQWTLAQVKAFDCSMTTQNAIELHAGTLQKTQRAYELAHDTHTRCMQEHESAKHIVSEHKAEIETLAPVESVTIQEYANHIQLLTNTETERNQLTERLRDYIATAPAPQGNKTAMLLCALVSTCCAALALGFLGKTGFLQPFYTALEAYTASFLMPAHLGLVGGICALMSVGFALASFLYRPRPAPTAAQHALLVDDITQRLEKRTQQCTQFATFLQTTQLVPAPSDALLVKPVQSAQPTHQVPSVQSIEKSDSTPLSSDISPDASASTTTPCAELQLQVPQQTKASTDATSLHEVLRNATRTLNQAEHILHLREQKEEALRMAKQLAQRTHKALEQAQSTVHQAQKEQTAAQQAWVDWLKQHGLDTNLSPTAAQRMLDIMNKCVETERSIIRIQRDIQQRRDEQQMLVAPLASLCTHLRYAPRCLAGGSANTSSCTPHEGATISTPEGIVHNNTCKAEDMAAYSMSCAYDSSRSADKTIVADYRLAEVCEYDNRHSRDDADNLGEARIASNRAKSPAHSDTTCFTRHTPETTSVCTSAWDWPATLDALLHEAKQAERTKERFERVQAVCTQLSESLVKSEQSVAITKESIATLLHQGGAEKDEERFRSRAAMWEKQQKLLQERDNALDMLSALANTGGEDIESLKRALAATNPESLREDELCYANEQEALTKQENTLVDELGTLRIRLEQLTTADTLVTLRRQENALIEELRTHAMEWSRYTIARHFILTAKHRFEAERQPQVIQYASSLFATITQGNWRGIVASLEDDSLHVLSHQGETVAPEVLSRGTQEQLYLALRMAYIQSHAAHAEPLPIIMDDILVNFDAARARQTAQAIAQLVQGTAETPAHQVLFFTCHPAMADILSDVVPASNRFLMQQGRIATTA